MQNLEKIIEKIIGMEIAGKNVIRVVGSDPVGELWLVTCELNRPGHDHKYAVTQWKDGQLIEQSGKLTRKGYRKYISSLYKEYISWLEKISKKKGGMISDAASWIEDHPKTSSIAAAAIIVTGGILAWKYFSPPNSDGNDNQQAPAQNQPPPPPQGGNTNPNVDAIENNDFNQRPIFDPDAPDSDDDFSDSEPDESDNQQGLVQSQFSSQDSDTPDSELSASAAFFRPARSENGQEMAEAIQRSESDMPLIEVARRTDDFKWNAFAVSVEEPQDFGGGNVHVAAFGQENQDFGGWANVFREDRPENNQEMEEEDKFNNGYCT